MNSRFTQKRFVLATVVAASLFSAQNTSHALDRAWIATSSTNLNDALNWELSTRPVVADWATFYEAGNHNPTLTANITSGFAQRLVFDESIVSPYSLTGNFTLTLGSNSVQTFVVNAANSNVTIDIAQLNMNRSSGLSAGDLHSTSTPGSGNTIIGHSDTSVVPQMVLRMGIGTNSNVFFSTYGTNNTLTVYPKVDFSGSTSTTTSNHTDFAPSATGTIKLLGGLTLGSSTASGNPGRTVYAVGEAGGVTILGDSTGWTGSMNILTSDLEINSSNSLGTTNPETQFTWVRSGAGNVGALRLNKGSGSDISTSEFIYTDGRDNASTPHIRNIGGNNTLSGVISDDGATGFVTISSDGTGVNNSLTLSGTIRREGTASGDLVLTGDGNGTVSGSITQLSTGVWNTVQKSGTGTWTFTGNNTYTGSTVVNQGTMVLSGSGAISTSSSIDVKSAGTFDVSAFSGGYTITPGQTLKGNGTIVGKINLGGSGTRTINPGDVGTVGTLNTGNVNLTGSGTLAYDLTSTPTNLSGINDLLNVVGNLTATGTTTIAVSAPGGLTAGTYNLINYSGALTGNQNNFTLSGVGGGGVRRTFDISTATTGQINLVIAGPGTASSVLTWVGGNNSNAWDTASTVNWSGGSGGDNRFFAGDSVVFDDAGSNSPPINVVGTVSPLDISTTNSAAHNYTFSSATGSIAATGNFSSTSAGNVTFAVKDFSVAGNFSHSGTGTVTFSNSGALSLGTSVALNNGTLALNTSNNVAINGPISGNGTLRADSGVVVTLAGDNIGFSGPILVNAGTLKLGNATALGFSNTTVANGASLDISAFSVSTSAVSLIGTGNVTVTGSGKLNLDVNGSYTIAKAIGGTGSVTATSNNGAVTLSGSNSHSGGTTILGGSITTATNGALGTGPLTFGDFGPTTGALNVNTNETVGALTVQSNSATPNAIAIGSGNTLNVTGNVTIGANSNTTGFSGMETRLSVTGGALNFVGGSTVNIGFPVASTSVVDLTSVNAFTSTIPTFNVGVGFSTTTSFNGSNIAATLLLSNTSNTITASSLVVGNSGTRNASPVLMQLGAGTNVLNVDSLTIGRGKGVPANLQFAVTDTTGTVNIAGAAGGSSTTNLIIGYFTGTGGSSGPGVLDFRGHVANVTGGTLDIGKSDTSQNSSGYGAGQGYIHFNNGSFTVNSISMAVKSGNYSTSTDNSDTIGEINVSGGNFTVNSGGTILMGSRAGNSSAVGSANPPDAPKSRATINVTGGTFTSNADFLQGAGTDVISTINLDGGTLNLTGHAFGDATPITNLGLKSGTLSNVGQINNGLSGLVKTTAGTLILAGSNTYTGDTTVSEGTLNIAGNHTTGANYSVASGANLITKNVRVTGSLTVDGTTTINANGGVNGASKVETIVIGAGGKLNLKDNDLVVGTAPNFDAVRAAIIAGKTYNAASGITSDITGFGISRGFGYAMGNDPKVSSLLAGSLAGQTYDADSVLVKFTLLGDADLDGDTDLNDLGLWSSGYTGDLGVTTSPTTFWTNGDFDYDGDTDLNDLGLWSSTYTGDFNGGPGSLVVNAPGASTEEVAILNSMGITVVPEPSTFVLAGVGLAGLAIASRRRKK